MSKHLDQPNCEARLRIWLNDCPGFVQDRSRERLITKLKVDAKVPPDWADFEAALKRCGYEIGFAQGYYVVALPTRTTPAQERRSDR